jgi:N-acyl-D-amino-acid deacylase
MTYDTLITGGRVVDGTGNAWFYADVAISGERIAAILPPGCPNTEHRTPNTEVIDASGHVVCPGFIDIQSHSISAFMRDRRSLSKVTQGVTTEIMGELWTPTPFGGRRKEPFEWGQLDPNDAEVTRGWTRFRDWIDWLTEKGVSVNFGSFVGGATLREYAMGWDAGEPTDAQLDVMRQVMAEAMEDGAFGVATALIYPPNAFSTPRELTEVAKVVSSYGGLYITHIRSEGDRLLEALEEAIDLGRDANVPVEIYHLKATGERNWPKMPAVIEQIGRARAEGVDIAADMYPYVFSGTGLTVLLPDWASEGGKLFERLEDPATRAKIRADMVGPGVEALTFANNPRRDYVYPLGFKRPENRCYIGKNLEEIAAERGQEWPDAAIDLILSERQWIGTLFVIMSEDNLRLQLKQPWIKISTDASGMDPAFAENPVHPRGYGTYTRVLAKYVREEKVLALEEAVRIMSSAVADRLGLRDRGQVRPGFFADLVIFDPETVQDRATFTDTHQLSTGIRDVWVNGARVLKDGAHTGAMQGRAVYGAGRR